jgi:hypothetical protein
MEIDALNEILLQHDPSLKIELFENDHLNVYLNKYLILSAWEANEILSLNNDFEIGHFETEKMADFILEITRGNIVFIEYRSFFRKLFLRKYRVLKKEMFFRIKSKFIDKKKVRLYSGNEIIQIAD